MAATLAAGRETAMGGAAVAHRASPAELPEIDDKRKSSQKSSYLAI